MLTNYPFLSRPDTSIWRSVRPANAGSRYKYSGRPTHTKHLPFINSALYILALYCHDSGGDNE